MHHDAIRTGTAQQRPLRVSQIKARGASSTLKAIPNARSETEPAASRPNAIWWEDEEYLGWVSDPEREPRARESVSLKGFEDEDRNFQLLYGHEAS